ncbi:hypothetical protein KY331_06130 [Candidatus Woesearchaeota archaeon]|nr:hypothetical protein [Candidatus Woesearchaeota archaeon]
MVFKFLKKKEEKLAPPIPKPKGAKELEIPPAPPSEEELPEFPEIPEFKEEEKPEIHEIPIAPPKPEPMKAEKPEAQKIEARAFKEERKELKKAEMREEFKPLFIKMESFQSIINELGHIKSIAKESEDAIARVDDFAGDQEKEFNKWHSQLNDMQKKLIFIDKTIFKE